MSRYIQSVLIKKPDVRPFCMFCPILLDKDDTGKKAKDIRVQFYKASITKLFNQGKVTNSHMVHNLPSKQYPFLRGNKFINIELNDEYDWDNVSDDDAHSMQSFYYSLEPDTFLVIYHYDEELHPFIEI